jgi:NTP pyrophosphatase (non-canonical NTP hydrolase)
MTFKELQDAQEEWRARNFPGQLDYHPLLGVTEEVGELCHAHLKGEQGIRHSDVRAMKADAVGDIVIFLAGYCTANGLDLQECVESALTEVLERDWVSNPMGPNA